MDTAFTAEQDGIRRTLREVVTKRCGPDDVKAAARTPTGYDTGLWTALAGRLGLPGLALPERYGGVGCGPLELALAGEELGRRLVPTPLLATAGLAAPLLLALGSRDQRAAHLPRIATGALTAALAVPGAALTTALGLVDGHRDDRVSDHGNDWTGGHRGDWAGGGRAGGVQARVADDGWRLYGQVDQVLDGHSAGLLLVAAHAGGYARSRTLLFLVRGDAPGLVRTRQTALDETRPRARLELRDAPAELLGGGEAGGEGQGATEGRDGRAGAAAVLAWTGDRAAALLAAEAVGAADHALARTVAHVKQREQFGRPIGSFQAVQHRLADVYVRVQAARSAAYYAAWAAGADAADAAPLPGPVTGGEGAEAPRAGGLALAQGLDALRGAAGEAVQLHGGIGFTWEHEAHLYVKRASGDASLFGPAHRLRAYAAERAGLFAGAGAGAGERTGAGAGASVGGKAGGGGSAGPPEPGGAAVPVAGAGA